MAFSTGAEGNLSHCKGFSLECPLCDLISVSPGHLTHHIKTAHKDWSLFKVVDPDKRYHHIPGCQLLEEVNDVLTPLDSEKVKKSFCQANNISSHTSSLPSCEEICLSDSDDEVQVLSDTHDAISIAKLGTINDCEKGELDLPWRSSNDTNIRIESCYSLSSDSSLRTDMGWRVNNANEMGNISACAVSSSVCSETCAQSSGICISSKDVCDFDALTEKGNTSKNVLKRFNCCDGDQLIEKKKSAQAYSSNVLQDDIQILDDSILKISRVPDCKNINVISCKEKSVSKTGKGSIYEENCSDKKVGRNHRGSKIIIAKLPRDMLWRDEVVQSNENYLEFGDMNEATPDTPTKVFGKGMEVRESNKGDENIFVDESDMNKALEYKVSAHEKTAKLDEFRQYSSVNSIAKTSASVHEKTSAKLDEFRQCSSVNSIAKTSVSVPAVLLTKESDIVSFESSLSLPEEDSSDVMPKSLVDGIEYSIQNNDSNLNLEISQKPLLESSNSSNLYSTGDKRELHDANDDGIRQNIEYQFGNLSSVDSALNIHDENKKCFATGSNGLITNTLVTCDKKKNLVKFTKNVCGLESVPMIEHIKTSAEKCGSSNFLLSPDENHTPAEVAEASKDLCGDIKVLLRSIVTDPSKEFTNVITPNKNVEPGKDQISGTNCVDVEPVAHEGINIDNIVPEVSAPQLDSPPNQRKICVQFCIESEFTEDYCIPKCDSVDGPPVLGNVVEKRAESTLFNTDAVTLNSVGYVAFNSNKNYGTLDSVHINDNNIDGVIPEPKFIEDIGVIRCGPEDGQPSLSNVVGRTVDKNSTITVHSRGNPACNSDENVWTLDSMQIHENNKDGADVFNKKLRHNESANDSSMSCSKKDICRKIKKVRYAPLKNNDDAKMTLRHCKALKKRISYHTQAKKRLDGSIVIDFYPNVRKFSCSKLHLRNIEKSSHSVPVCGRNSDVNKIFNGKTVCKNEKRANQRSKTCCYKLSQSRSFRMIKPVGAISDRNIIKEREKQSEVASKEIHHPVLRKSFAKNLGKRKYRKIYKNDDFETRKCRETSSVREITKNILTGATDKETVKCISTSRLPQLMPPDDTETTSSSVNITLNLDHLKAKLGSVNTYGSQNCEEVEFAIPSCPLIKKLSKSTSHVASYRRKANIGEILKDGKKNLSPKSNICHIEKNSLPFASNNTYYTGNPNKNIPGSTTMQENKSNSRVLVQKECLPRANLCNVLSSAAKSKIYKCKKYIIGKQSLRSYKPSLSPLKPFKCSKCLFACSSKVDLVAHAQRCFRKRKMNTFKGKKSNFSRKVNKDEMLNVACFICQESLESKFHFVKHLYRYHRDKANSESVKLELVSLLDISDDVNVVSTKEQCSSLVLEQIMTQNSENEETGVDLSSSQNVEILIETKVSSEHTENLDKNNISSEKIKSTSKNAIEYSKLLADSGTSYQNIDMTKAASHTSENSMILVKATSANRDIKSVGAGSNTVQLDERNSDGIQTLMKTDATLIEADTCSDQTASRGSYVCTDDMLKLKKAVKNSEGTETESIEYKKSEQAKELVPTKQEEEKSYFGKDSEAYHQDLVRLNYINGLLQRGKSLTDEKENSQTNSTDCERAENTKHCVYQNVSLSRSEKHPVCMYCGKNYKNVGFRSHMVECAYMMECRRFIDTNRITVQTPSHLRNYKVRSRLDNSKESGPWEWKKTFTTNEFYKLHKEKECLSSNKAEIDRCVELTVPTSTMPFRFFDCGTKSLIDSTDVCNVKSSEIGNTNLMNSMSDSNINMLCKKTKEIGKSCGINYVNDSSHDNSNDESKVNKLKQISHAKSYKCMYCMDEFMSNVNIEFHLRQCKLKQKSANQIPKSDGYDDYKCKYCNKVYVSKYTLKYHLIRCNRKKALDDETPELSIQYSSFECLFCKRRFYCKLKFKCHIERCSRVRNNICLNDTCFSIMSKTDKCNLKINGNNSKINLEENKCVYYKCIQCSKLYASKFTLQYHTRFCKTDTMEEMNSQTIQKDIRCNAYDMSIRPFHAIPSHRKRIHKRYSHKEDIYKEDDKCLSEKPVIKLDFVNKLGSQERIKNRVSEASVTDLNTRENNVAGYSTTSLFRDQSLAFDFVGFTKPLVCQYCGLGFAERLYFQLHQSKHKYKKFSVINEKSFELREEDNRYEEKLA
ncbi:hypothetical protein SK128_000300 [Halocaridina rubra]|uniref:C2H2-type domain-containing protein n=1 Tax=Halocaridina rubra TaxID=373956 RepID=A0AAN8WJ63_HALRR